MDSMSSKMAYFSTNGGKYPPRPAPAIRPRGIIRGDGADRDARDAFVTRLRKDFPDKCKDIAPNEPGSPADVYEYFDAYDISVHGLSYLVLVISQIGTQNLCRKSDLAKFVEVWRDKNEDVFWSMTHASTVQQIFNAEDLEAYDEEWLGEALKRIWSLRDLQLPKGKPINAQLPTRGNFHSDPEQWVSDQVNEDISSTLTGTSSRTVVARTLDGNPSSQIQSRIPSQLAVQLSHRVQFPVPPQPRPRRTPVPMPVSNDARVLERLEEQQATTPPYSAVPIMPIIPEQQSFSSLIRGLPIPNITSTDTIIDQPRAHRPTSARQMSMPYTGNEQAPSVQAAKAGPNKEGPPRQAGNPPIGLQWQMQVPSKQPLDHNNRSSNPTIPTLPVQPQVYRPPHAYSHPPPQPIYCGPQVQPHQLQNYTMLANVSSTGSQRLYSVPNQSGQPGQKYVGKERRGSGASRDKPRSPQHRKNGRSSSGNPPPFLGDKLWVGNLCEHDTTQALVSIFAPLGGYEMKPLRKSSYKWASPNGYFTFVKFNNNEQAAAAKEMLDRREFPQLDGRQLKISYANHNVETREDGFQRRIRADTPHNLSNWNQPPTHLPTGRQLGTEPSSLPLFNYSGSTIPNQVANLHQSPPTPILEEFTPVDLVPAVPNHGPEAGADYGRRPRLSIDTALQRPSQQTATGEILPPRTDTTRYVGKMEMSQGSNKVDRSISPAQMSDTEQQRGRTPPSCDDRFSPHSTATDSTVMRIELGHSLEDQRLERKIPLHEATGGVEAKPGTTVAEHQDAPPTVPRPPMAHLESTIDTITTLPDGLAQAIGADPDIGPIRSSAQEGASQGAYRRNNKYFKKKSKSQPTADAGRQGITESQISEEVDQPAVAKIETAAAAADVPAPQQTAIVPPVDRKRPPKKPKNKNRRPGGQDNLDVSAKATESKVTGLSEDRLTKHKEQTFVADASITEHVVSQEMARDNSGSSQDPAPTPALGHFSTKATTIAPSEGSDAETKIQEIEWMRSNSDQRSVEKDAEAELLLNLSRGNSSANIVVRSAVEKATHRTEKLPVNYPFRTGSQSPKRMALEVIPAVPDISKIHQRYWDEQRLQEVQKRLKNFDATEDRTALEPSSEDSEKSSASRELAIELGSAAKEESEQQILEYAEHAADEPDSAIEESVGLNIIEPKAATGGKINVTPESSPAEAQMSQSTGMKETQSSESSDGDKPSEVVPPTEEPPMIIQLEKPQNNPESHHGVNDSQDSGLGVTIDASASAVKVVMTHKKKQKKKRQETHSRDQSPSSKLDSQVAALAGLAAETDVECLSAAESIQQLKEQDSHEAGKSLTDPQDYPTPREEHPDSVAGSEPDEAQPLDPAIATHPPKKKKKKSKKSKGKAKISNDQQEAIAASDEVPGPDDVGSIQSKHLVERPWDVDVEASANNSRAALKHLLTAEKPDQVDEKASAVVVATREQTRDLASEVHQEPTMPKPPSMQELFVDYYAQKEKSYTPLLLNPKGPVATKDSQDNAKEESAKGSEHTPKVEHHDQRQGIHDQALDQSIEEPGPSVSPRTHQRVMLQVMTDCGYILENGSNVEKENQQNQLEEYSQHEGPMSDPQVQELKKLLHVSKTVVRKEFGSHGRTIILNTLPPDVVEAYIEGSLGLESAKFEGLDDDMKAQVRHLAEIDEEEVILKATLKENEDDAPETSPHALSARDRELQSMEVELFRGLRFDNSVKAFAAEIGDGLKDPDARRDFEKAVPKVKENMEARCHDLWMQSHEKYDRDADGRLTNTSRLAIGREITGPSLRAMRAELTAKALEARYHAERRKEIEEDDPKLLPNFDDRVNDILGALAQCIRDPHIIRGLQEKVAEAKQAVEDKYRKPWAEFRRTLSKDHRGRWTESSKEAIDQKFRVPALNDFHIQIKLRILEHRDEVEEPEENQRPIISPHTSEPMSPRRRGSPVLRASITHGDSTKEIISISGRRPKDISNLKTHDVTPDLSPTSGLFLNQIPLLPPRPPAMETPPHAARLLRRVRAAWDNGPNLDAAPPIRPVTLPPIRPVTPREIAWQWPGEPTPNLILKNVLYTRLGTSTQYKAVFHIEPHDDLITNAADTCVEAVVRDDISIWYRDHPLDDIVAADLRVVNVNDLNWLRETIDAGKEPTWQEIVAGAAEQGLYLIKKQTSDQVKQRPFVDRKPPPLETYLPESHRGQSTGRRVGDLLWGVPRGERAWGCGEGEEGERVDPYFSRIA